MRRSRTSRTSKKTRAKALPWAALAQAVFVVGKRVGRLSADDRARLGSLLRESRGWPGRLRPRDRAELRKLVRKLDLKGMGRELSPLLRGGKRTLKGTGKRR